jgi:hypothetical protein
MRPYATTIYGSYGRVREIESRPYVAPKSMRVREREEGSRALENRAAGKTKLNLIPQH